MSERYETRGHHEPARPTQGVEVEVEDIKRVYSLFVDVKRSTQFLVEYQNEFMFSELENPDADMTDARV